MKYNITITLETKASLTQQKRHMYFVHFWSDQSEAQCGRVETTGPAPEIPPGFGVKFRDLGLCFCDQKMGKIQWLLKWFP